MQKKVLILGATGRYGAAVMSSFAQQGWQVVAQSRSSGKPMQGVTWLSAQPHDHKLILNAAQGAQVVVHAWNPSYTAWQKELLPLTEAALNITEALNATLLLPGNVYNYGSQLPPVLTEQLVQQADTRKGMLRIQLEEKIRQRCNNGHMRAVVMRAGDFFGAGTGSWFDLVIIKDLHKGKLTYPGDMQVPHAWAYLPDLADTSVKLMHEVITQPARFSRYEVFHYAGHHFTGQTLLNEMQNLSARKLKLSSMPWGVIAAGKYVVPMWREISEMKYLWFKPHALDDTKLKAVLGDMVHTPLQQALANASSL